MMVHSALHPLLLPASLISHLTSCFSPTPASSDFSSNIWHTSSFYICFLLRDCYSSRNLHVWVSLHVYIWKSLSQWSLPPYFKLQPTLPIQTDPLSHTCVYTHTHMPHFPSLICSFLNIYHIIPYCIIYSFYKINVSNCESCPLPWVECKLHEVRDFCLL